MVLEYRLIQVPPPPKLIHEIRGQQSILSVRLLYLIQMSSAPLNQTTQLNYDIGCENSHQPVTECLHFPRIHSSKLPKTAYQQKIKDVIVLLQICYCSSLTQKKQWVLLRTKNTCHIPYGVGENNLNWIRLNHKSWRVEWKCFEFDQSVASLICHKEWILRVNAPSWHTRIK